MTAQSEGSGPAPGAESAGVLPGVGPTTAELIAAWNDADAEHRGRIEAELHNRWEAKAEPARTVALWVPLVILAAVLALAVGGGIALGHLLR
jgi:hypothetical protein